MQVELRQAEAMNLVRRENGTYVETTKAEQQAAEAAKLEQARQQQEPQTEDAGNVNRMTETPFPAEVQAKIDQALGGREEAEWVPAIAEYVRTGNVEKVASRLTMPTEQAQVLVDTLNDALSAQATAAIAEVIPTGDLTQFEAWVMEHRPRQYQRALTNHLYAKSVDGYKALANEYARSVEPTAEALQRGGYETRMDANSQRLLVKIDGQWFSVAAATKQGLI